ncbi:MAG TPA: Gfo/Idh/MocA family oxidoreductase [Alphaproteobacteria bacterium]|jgi:predicted dehydrogenase|nr:Gfo/Idh/MocA family oxidoreductase [Alphaproteobacteria bacterium]
MTALKFGVIGMSEGNGHPYSWSAIFNGYDADAMRDCPFPAIPEYLARRRFPGDAIAGAHVTEVWAEDRGQAEHIARAAKIDRVVDDFREMIGRVDGVLLARDDAENHARFAAPFLEAGVPVYIDKPLALSVAAALELLARQKFPGQIFTCSALRYAREFELSEGAKRELGVIRFVQGTVPKDWDRYAIHVIEPALNVLGRQGAIVESDGFHAGDVHVANIVWESGVIATFSALGKTAAPIALRFVGTLGHRDMVFADSFSAFKSALMAFVKSVTERRAQIPPDVVLDAVAVIEAGRKAH